MTINPTLTTLLFFCFPLLEDYVVTVVPSHFGLDYRYTNTEYPPTHTHLHFFLFPSATTNKYNYHAHESTASITMSFNSQTTCGTSFDVTPSPAPPIVNFQLNQARRANVAGELETLRSAFLEWPTLEGLEAFVEKKTEFNEMVGDHIADLQAVTQEQIVIAQGFERAAKVAEERRLQEFQRALERMDPVEAEAARKAERERAFRLQREREARLAELDAEFARIRARVRAKYPTISERSVC